MVNKSKPKKAPAKAAKGAANNELVRPTKKPSKGKAATARASTKDGLKKTRSNSASRGEVRQQTVHRQGHPK